MSKSLLRLWQWLVPPGTKLRDLAVPITFIAWGVIVSRGSLQVYHAQERAANLIEVAGRQRTLLERYTRQTEEQDEDAAAATLERIRYNAMKLRDGGEYVPSGSVLPGPVQTPFKLTPSQGDLRLTLTDQLRVLDEMKKLLVQERQFERPRLVDEAKSLATQASAFYVAQSQARVRRLLGTSIAITSLLIILGLWLSRMIVERAARLREMEEARSEALRSSEAKSRFLANMSHEIRTPLNAIIGMTDILQGTPMSSDQKRYVETLRRGGDTLLTLINDVLDLSKIESGQMEVRLAGTDLPELIERVGEILALRAHQKALELTCFISPEVPRHVLADETRLRQVLVNLLGNALKFTSAGEVGLRVELERRDGDSYRVRFSVHDTGIGISEAQQERIFDSFTQADASISANYGGTGLGLAISKKLVETMGGQLSVKSRPGAGSTFMFVLPLTADHRGLQPAVSALHDLRGKRALIVDDNDTNRFILRRYLFETGVAVEEARGGAEALETLARVRQRGRSFDLILLDQRMPGMSGTEVVRKMQRDRLARGAAVIVLTSDVRRSTDAAAAIQSRIREFVAKPVRRLELLEVVASALAESETAGKGARQNASDRAQAGGSGADEASGRPYRGVRALVVDDVEDNRIVVGTYLRDLGIEVDEAASGAEAVTQAASAVYDVIFMDMRMSPVDGYSATRTIREQERRLGAAEVPIIAFTAHAFTEEIDQALASGCTLHLTKPVTRGRLRATLDEVLGDSPAARGLKGEDAALISRLEPFLESCHEDLDRLGEALRAGNASLVASIGHDLSGTAGVYRLEALGKLARELEGYAKDDDLVQAARAKGEMESYLSGLRAS